MQSEKDNYDQETYKFDSPDEQSLDIYDMAQEAEVERLCRWAAARAGVVVMLPIAGTMALIANEVYLVKKIGDLHGYKLNDSVILGFIASLGASVVGSTLATLFPYSPTKILIGVGLTYGIGKAAHEWLKAGQPEDLSAIKEVFNHAKQQACKNIKSFLNNPNKNKADFDE